ncbi:MAG: hypothetical protein WBW89_14515 [Candidatus Cybelea sp.]
MTSIADLKQAIGAPSEANVVRHLQARRRGPQRATVKSYADALGVSELYLLALAGHVDEPMIGDAQRVVARILRDARPLIQPNLADDLYARITATPVYGRIAAAVYLAVQRDRAECDTGLRERERHALALLRSVVEPLGIDLQRYVVRPKPDVLVDLAVWLDGKHDLAPFAKLIRAFARALYEQCGVDCKAADRELQAFDRDPSAWIKNYEPKENLK